MNMQIKALVLTLTLMLVSVFAVPFSAPASEVEDIEVLDIAITKILHMAEGTVTPHVQFVFDVTPYGFNYDRSRAGLLPALNSSVVTFTPLDVAEAEDGMLKHYRQSDSLLQGVNFPCPGYFTYRISLREDSFQNTKTETMILDKSVWQLTFCVEYLPTSSASTAPATSSATELYVSAIDVQRVSEDGVLGSKVGTDELSFLSLFSRDDDPDDPGNEDPPPEDDPPGDKDPDDDKPENLPEDDELEDDIDNNNPGGGGGTGSGGSSNKKGPRTGDPGDSGLWLWSAAISLIISVLTALKLGYRKESSAESDHPPDKAPSPKNVPLASKACHTARPRHAN